MGVEGLMLGALVHPLWGGAPHRTHNAQVQPGAVHLFASECTKANVRVGIALAAPRISISAKVKCKFEPTKNESPTRSTSNVRLGGVRLPTA